MRTTYFENVQHLADISKYTFWTCLGHVATCSRESLTTNDNFPFRETENPESVKTRGTQEPETMTGGATDRVHSIKCVRFKLHSST